MVRITAPGRTRLRTATLVRSGVRVRAACRAVGRVRVTLVVSTPVARRLGLARRTLANRLVPCGERLSVRLAPRGRARRVLRRTERAFGAGIEVRAGALRDRRQVKFR
jgi:hypothetical protein